ncbi:type II toxin-antitoxin system VapC family toxin [Mesorhizobium sp. M7A.F.Ca.CA.001.09.2.1]|jgi:tRNA(fMet)-specific endonuclease VapC|uniref:Ribonuclease VapC n=3 Tax=Mesorhizobium TaxID=68287 RepID=A0AB38T3H8_9HYPH|nr:MULTISPECIES: type II toxin-antitoxin system VapC family toxin [Mesorhizobium]RUY40040.1 type II toxin-antitoxin system VapC family toxin [Mesorhizobium sp. M7A.F.Ca.CA.001.13.2.1]MDF3212705.1 type II toxin-antitoxin system VapC family toxin [Mesorhizobium ciceri]RUY66550.1 type II toxin-antitoxin system VapC family toxin [Mesorhizobium sp. M7A.F.Ca.CA.001.13.1.1]RUY71446.1 type II toxin-antitoxin system VapC family toxin [Mesorhizobium sp. M7A.F.Ca.CA.001.05.1.1]RUY74899.1 type II toxin-an
MRFMLDTNIISDMIRNPAGKAARAMSREGDDAVCTSIVVASELRYGCARKGSAKLLKKVEDLLAEIPVLPLDVPVDAEYGGLRAELEAAGQTIGHNDLFIAAHACALGATLVTANTGEFTRIRNLKVENWLA